MSAVTPDPMPVPGGGRLQAVWSNAHYAWCTRDLWVFRYTYATGILNPVFRLPPRSSSLTGRFKDALARSRLKRWLSPGTDVDTLVELPGGDLVVLFDQVYWYSPSQHTGMAEALRSDAEPPLKTPLRGGLAVHPVSGNVYFGEYLDETRGTRVARVDVKARSVSVCWTFPRSDIKHVHAIHYDRFRHRLWICTGDHDHESAFWYTDDEFQTVQRFAGGDQSWRAIAVLFDETGMEWGMDAGQDAPADAINRIYRYNFETHQRSECAVIGNPAYAACELDDGTAVMQTSFEPLRRQNTPEEVTLWWRDGQRQWRPVLNLQYQPRPRDGVGLYGHLLLPNGISPARQLLCTPVNTARHAMRLLRLLRPG